MTGCKECSGTITCTTCLTDKGYWRDPQLVCKACPTNCLSCSGSKTCTTCAGGYFKQTVENVDFCKACKANCLDCGSATTCSKCKAGYLKSGENCNACEIDKCIEYVADTNPCQCSKCSSGTLQEDDTKCIVCETGCKTCSSTDTCTACSDGYYLDNANCVACSEIKENCAKCSSSACTECSNGYYLDVTECKACSGVLNNCLTCTSETVCTKCIAGNVLKTDKSGCFECGGLDDDAIDDCN